MKISAYRGHAAVINMLFFAQTFILPCMETVYLIWEKSKHTLYPTSFPFPALEWGGLA